MQAEHTYTFAFKICYFTTLLGIRLCKKPAFSPLSTQVCDTHRNIPIEWEVCKFLYDLALNTETIVTQKCEVT